MKIRKNENSSLEYGYPLNLNSLDHRVNSKLGKFDLNKFDQKYLKKSQEIAKDPFGRHCVYDAANHRTMHRGEIKLMVIYCATALAVTSGLWFMSNLKRKEKEEERKDREEDLISSLEERTFVDGVIENLSNYWLLAHWTSMIPLTYLGLNTYKAMSYNRIRIVKVLLSKPTIKDNKKIYENIIFENFYGKLKEEKINNLQVYDFDKSKDILMLKPVKERIGDFNRCVHMSNATSRHIPILWAAFN